MNKLSLALSRKPKAVESASESNPKMIALSILHKAMGGMIDEDQDDMSMEPSDDHFSTGQDEEMPHLSMPEGENEEESEMSPLHKVMGKPRKMADGGPVDDIPEPNPKSAAEMQKGATSSGIPSWDEVSKNLKEGLGLAEGGEVESPLMKIMSKKKLGKR